MKICVVISSHSSSVYTKLTVATLKRAFGNNHELDIHIGVHSNYSNYTSDFSIFEELKGVAQIHCVDEIDWEANARNNYRYSMMHCKNIENLFKNIRYYDFDYVVVLDNDMYIKSDFISLLTEGKEDLIFSYYNRSVQVIDNERRPTGEYSATVQFAPKIACCNAIISRKLYDKIMEDVSIIYPERISDPQRISYYKQYMPEIVDGFRSDYDSDASYMVDGLKFEPMAIVFDTLSKVLFNSIHLWDDIKTLEVDVSDMITHYFCSSFNYGVGIVGNVGGDSIADKAYKLEFPNGIK